MKRKPKDYLIVALDVPNAREALALVEKLAKRVGMFKVGKRLFTREGPQLVRRILKMGAEVFLDLKYHDIPNTVGDASLEAAALGVKMFNVHCLGSRKMLTQARAMLDSRLVKKRPLMLGVTILTSHNYEDFVDMGLFPQIGWKDKEKETALRKLVVRLAIIAKECMLDGVVASPLEAKDIRKACGKDFLIVTPGIRPAPDKKSKGRTMTPDDQERVMTPFEAIRTGIDYMVVGRPIYGALDPLIAAERIVKEIASAL